MIHTFCLCQSKHLIHIIMKAGKKEQIGGVENPSTSKVTSGLENKFSRGTLDLLQHHLLRLELFRKFGAGPPSSQQEPSFATLRSLITSRPNPRLTSPVDSSG